MQVVAITVYFLLSVAFYAFFSPFLGKDIYEHVAIAVYSFLVNVCSVLITEVAKLVGRVIDETGSGVLLLIVAGL